jgi:hypothetical protein
MTGSQENIVFGGGVISTGDNNQINNAIGDGNRQVNTRDEMRTAGPDPWGPLARELARIRERLAEDRGDSVDAVDLDDAFGSVTAAEREISSTGDRGPDARRNMRLRIKGLIGILAPVAEIIGGVAALEAIVQHL